MSSIDFNVRLVTSLMRIQSQVKISSQEESDRTVAHANMQFSNENYDTRNSKVAYSKHRREYQSKLSTDHSPGVQ